MSKKEIAKNYFWRVENTPIKPYTDNELLNLFIERGRIISDIDNFLKDETDSDGKISKAAADKADEMMGDVLFMTYEIKNAIENRPTTAPILPEVPRASDSKNFGVSGREYRQHFLDAVRNNFSNVQNNYLQVADPTQGGYLVPEEMHETIIVKLRDNNILRKIGRVIQTQGLHKITLQATAPTAQWTPEGQPINLSSMTFDQKSLDAYKLTVGLSISNEIKADSYYNLEEHIINEFSAAIAELEEQTFFSGDGQGKPLGLLPQMTALNSAFVTATTAGSTIASDDIISLIHTLPRPYRSSACFVMDDTTLATIRKLKDTTTNYIWQPSIQSGEPSSLFGYPVYTSPNVPTIASGNLAVLFGDFSKFVIGQRGNMVFRPLYEIMATQDLSVYLMIERVDCVVTDTTAIVGLKIK